MGLFDFLGDVIDGVGDLVGDAIDFVDDLLTDDSSNTQTSSSNVSSNSSNSGSDDSAPNLTERDMVGFKSSANVYYSIDGAKYNLTDEIRSRTWWINNFENGRAVLTDINHNKIKARVEDLYYDPFVIYFNDSANVYYNAKSGAKYTLTDEIKDDYWAYDHDDPNSSKLAIIMNSDGECIKARKSDLYFIKTPFDDYEEDDEYEEDDSAPNLTERDMVGFKSSANVYYSIDGAKYNLTDEIRSRTWWINNFENEHVVLINLDREKIKARISDLYCDPFVMHFNDSANVYYNAKSGAKYTLTDEIKNNWWAYDHDDPNSSKFAIIMNNDGECIKARKSDLYFTRTPFDEDEENDVYDDDYSEEVCDSSSQNQKGNTMAVNDNYNGYQFTALGLSGSGKTCFMAGMYYKMTGGVSGYTLKADDDDSVNLTAYYEQMTNAQSGADRFPGGTNQSTDYSFELQYGYKTLEKFRWVDYAGGTLKSKNTGDAEEYSKLKNDIAKSEMLYIFVDGGLFQDEEVSFASSDSEKIEILTDIVMESCSRQINHFLSEYTSERKKLPPIAIVVTKYDLAVKALGKADNNENLEMLYKVIQRAFNPLFPDPSMYNGNEGHTSMVGIIPVSLGFKISEGNYTGKLRPINMHMPAYVGIWFMLKAKNNNDTSVKKLADEIEDSGIKFWLNGQTGKFSTLAEGYLKNVKG